LNIIVPLFSSLKDLNLLVDTLIAGNCSGVQSFRCAYDSRSPAFLNSLNLLVDTLITCDCTGDRS
jgi:hypothetical protein